MGDTIRHIHEHTHRQAGQPKPTAMRLPNGGITGMSVYYKQQRDRNKKPEPPSRDNRGRFAGQDPPDPKWFTDYRKKQGWDKSHG